MNLGKVSWAASTGGHKGGRIVPRLRAAILLLFAVVASASGQTPTAARAKATRPAKVHLNAKTLSFTRPGTKDVFTLHLGEELLQDTGGITAAPRNVKLAVRDATSSYYEPVDKDRGTYAAAESLYTRNMAGEVAQRTNIQYQPDTGRLLITEDKTDALPCFRYILYTPGRSGGYEVTYLAPGFIQISGPSDITSVPAEIRLLPGDRAEVNHKIVKVNEIVHSSHPFSLGP